MHYASCKFSMPDISLGDMLVDVQPKFHVPSGLIGRIDNRETRTGTNLLDKLRGNGCSFKLRLCLRLGHVD